ncbi:MAG: serine hydrolase [Bacteroidetes bacterium 4572_77]|nr:MAG: serine hydrolase [Bacteroidetes bacterium 4572_77]
MGILKFTLYLFTFSIVAYATVGLLEEEEQVEEIVTVVVPEEPAAEIFPLNPQQEYIVDSLLQRRLKINGFRGTALVAYKNQILTQYAHGYSDYRTKEKIGVESVFQLASVSKSFTATSIMILKERGLLEYDDLVVKYIPEFPYDNISIEQLLQHTSGLQNYMYLVDNYWNNDTLISNEDVLDLLVKYNLALNNWPGKRFLYSNTGYAMLALVVERVSGNSFGEFLKTEIFEVCGMENSYTFSHEIMDTLSTKVIGYNRKGRRLFRYNFEPNDMVLGDKSVYSTINDLFSYQKTLNAGKIVHDSTLTQAYTKGVLSSRYKRSFNYGYGWRLKETANDSLVYHNGLWHGFASTLTKEMNKEITVILLNNTTSGISAIKSDLLRIAENQIEIFELENAKAKESIAHQEQNVNVPKS